MKKEKRKRSARKRRPLIWLVGKLRLMS